MSFVLNHSATKVENQNTKWKRAKAKAVFRVVPLRFQYHSGLQTRAVKLIYWMNVWKVLNIRNRLPLAQPYRGIAMMKRWLNIVRVPSTVKMPHTVSHGGSTLEKSHMLSGFG